MYGRCQLLARHSSLPCKLTRDIPTDIKPNSSTDMGERREKRPCVSCWGCEKEKKNEINYQSRRRLLKSLTWAAAALHCRSTLSALDISRARESRNGDWKVETPVWLIGWGTHSNSFCRHNSTTWRKRRDQNIHRFYLDFYLIFFLRVGFRCSPNCSALLLRCNERYLVFSIFIYNFIFFSCMSTAVVSQLRAKRENWKEILRRSWNKLKFNLKPKWIQNIFFLARAARSFWTRVEVFSV